MAEESHSTIKLKPATFHRLQDFAASVGRPAAELAEEAIDRWGLVPLFCYTRNAHITQQGAKGTCR